MTAKGEMAGERDVLAEALTLHIMQSGWVRGSNAAATEARGILDLIAARGWRLVPAAPSSEPAREAGGAEHDRQSAAGTHLFDEGCRYCCAAESDRLRAAATDVLSLVGGAHEMAGERPEFDAAAEALRDELSEEWTSVERAIWPQGPAHGHGSGAYAALKARIIAALPEPSPERLSLTRQPPLAPELWRDAYARIAGQYAVFLERYDLAEDATAEDIIEAISRAAPSPEPLPLDVELRKLVANFIEDHDEGRLGNPDPIWCDGKCTGVRGLRAALSPDRPT